MLSTTTLLELLEESTPPCKLFVEIVLFIIIYVNIIIILDLILVFQVLRLI